MYGKEEEMGIEGQDLWGGLVDVPGYTLNLSDRLVSP